MIDPRPCSATEAVQRALKMIRNGGVYELGTGDYRPRVAGGVLTDVPWTAAPDGSIGSDCAGFAIAWCYKLQRHRPGYNKGAWSTVEDDLNCNSAIEDADHAHDLFDRVTTPFPGALLVYPTIRLAGHPQPWIGHVSIVTSVARCVAWDPERPDYSLLDVAQCCGPNGRGPAVIASDGAIWTHHDHQWPKPEHRTVMLRALP